MNDEVLEIHLLADSTGESGVRIARAAVAQFPAHEFTLVRHRSITTTTALLAVLDLIRARRGRPTAVLMTLVNRELVSLVRSACAELDAPCVDLMSDTLRALEQITGTRADEVAQRPVGVEADYFKRMAAIDFAVRHDDGGLPALLGEADICLVGPSRSGKTPLSIYLGYLGYKTVNVPIVPGIAPPAELFTIDPWRIVGLTMDAERLQSIRSQRVAGMGLQALKGGYADLAAIHDELDEIRTLHRRLRCPVLDTTGRALEELASRVVELVADRGLKLGGHLRRPPGVALRPPGATAAGA